MVADKVTRHEAGSWRSLAMALLLALWLQSLPWSGIGLLLRPDFLLLLVPHSLVTPQARTCRT